MVKRLGCLFGALGLLGCGSAVSVPGAETSPCDEGRCDNGLECVMDECVAPEGGTGTGTGDPPSTTGATTANPTEPPPAEATGEDPPEAAAAVDVLVVLDDSGTMAEEQERVAAQLPALVDGLVDGGFDVRIATTTTDTGNYWCLGAGVSNAENGQFVLSSCLGRLNEFYFSGTDANGEAACTNNCALDDISTTPAVPWIEASAAGSNLDDGVGTREALGCVVPQGISGCGFETPLASMLSALRLSDSSSQDEFEFLRPNAHLLVLLVSDEADCSYNPQLQNTVFGEEGVGNQVFWSLPDQQFAPSSAVCWNAGVRCDGGNCQPENYDVNGSVTDSADDAALVPVATYLAELASLRANKNALGAEVFVFGILGVPESYPETGTLTYAPGPDGNDAESFQARFGIGPGCATATGEAVPPVRMRAVIESEQMSDANNIFSICSEDYSAAFAEMSGAVSSFAP